MGIVKEINPVYLSQDDVTLESGKLMRRFWRDRTVNSLLRRIPA